MKLIDNLIQKWNVKCIIFDLDGTLVNTLDYHIEAFKILFKEINRKIPYEEIEDNMGRTPKDTLLSLIPELNFNKKQLEILSKRKEEILTNLLSDIPIFPGSKEILDYLKYQKIIICLASSTPYFNVSKMIENASFSSYFDVIITGEDITIGKPNPEVFLKAVEKAKIDKKHCLIIGDSPHDIEAAKTAGINIIAVATGKHSKEQIKETKPNLLVSSLTDLLE
ncbi:MAG: HAD family phosphatase [Asgard group archaeon]|nr:HAD family phosphatase [Asgard group archaeon]